eukprot:CAMPEP_0115012118 /NCGR_PEP_ID=MMETSP0216-20121206/24509_1 /TAXON_ID=223996 /ORGANISM="Protocruzia adherens, Strain Boccale" /LENGTH=532 /DNA_ID=CAMNT_0002381039 /DNA_START=309 /DNA_END=1907 /DNA_ORIENTATION=+
MSDEVEVNFDTRRQKFKSGLNVAEAKKKRDEMTEQLRKQKKDNTLNLKRRLVNVLNPDSDLVRDESQNQILNNMPVTGAKPDLVATFQNILSVLDLSLINDPKNENNFHAVQAFRKYLSTEDEPPIKEVIASGAVPMLIKVLAADGNPALQYEASWALTNLASASERELGILLGHDLVGEFMKLLNSSHDELKEQALWGLGNIAGENPDCRDMLLQRGMVGCLLKILNEKVKLSILRIVAWCFSNLSRGKPEPPLNQVSVFIPYIARLLQVDDTEVLTDSCWALSYISDMGNEANQELLNNGCAEPLIKLLTHEDYHIQVPALRACGNIITGLDKHTQTMLNFGVLSQLSHLIGGKKKNLKKEALWTLSNIAAGTATQVTMLLQNRDILLNLRGCCKHPDVDVSREAVWTFSNIFSGAQIEQIDRLIEMEILEDFDTALTSQDIKTVVVTLEGLESILKKGDEFMRLTGQTKNIYAMKIDARGLLEKIEELQEHKNNEIYQKSLTLIEKYYDHEEVQGAGMDNAMNVGRFDV